MPTGHENGGWMNEDQRDAERAAAKLQDAARLIKNRVWEAGGCEAVEEIEQQIEEGEQRDL